MASTQTAPSRPGPLRLALFESQPLYLAGMRAALEAGPSNARVLESPGPFEARADTLRRRPDMVILGVASPRDMLATLRELRSVLSMMPPIVLVAPRGLPATLELAIELTDAFVLRTAAVDELSCAIEEVRQGRSYLSPAVNSPIDQRAGAQRSSPLTDRELTVVKLIALGHHNREIAHDLGLSVRTVESHRAHALYKLQLTSRTELVHWALHEHVI